MRTWSGETRGMCPIEPSFRLLIAGASVRAAAYSAIRAGCGAPIAADLFGDQDLKAIATVLSLEPRYKNLPTIAARTGADVWMFTGALENYPSIVQSVSRKVPLLGNPAATIRLARDPNVVASALRNANLPTPDLGTEADESLDSSWLCKPRRSAGGLGIRRYEAAGRANDECYYQRFIDGVARAGVFVAAGGGAALLGVTNQLIGEDRFGASGFQYAGSIGPVALSPGEHRQWSRIGDCLARRLGLLGLFGVDAVVNERGVFVVEVNPRFPASVEILERGSDWSAVGLHWQACRNQWVPPLPIGRPPPHLGKAIVFVRQPTRVSAGLLQLLARWNSRPDGPWVADVPHAESLVPARHPLVTVFAQAESLKKVSAELARRAAKLHAFGHASALP